MSFNYQIRRKADPLLEGIHKALRGEPTGNDMSADPSYWSLEKIKSAAKEQQRREDEYEAGAWPMSHKF